MGKYAGQAGTYSSNAQVMITKLESLKQQFEGMLEDFGVDGKGNFVDGINPINDGDYLTEHVIADLTNALEDVNSLISNIDGRISSINAEARRLDIILDQNNSTTQGEISPQEGGEGSE